MWFCGDYVILWLYHILFIYRSMYVCTNNKIVSKISSSTFKRSYRCIIPEAKKWKLNFNKIDLLELCFERTLGESFRNYYVRSNFKRNAQRIFSVNLIPYIIERTTVETSSLSSFTFWLMSVSRDVPLCG